jgi:Ser/Thr protein kinase RdoA (MazF antagonist)
VLPTLRSLPDASALATHLGRLYGIDFTDCILLRSLVNDVYELTADDARYILKLYRYGGHTPAEIRWEAGLSAHLVANGLLAPPVLPLPDGEPVGLLDAPEGPRPFVLHNFIAGAKPQPPFDDALYEEFGVLVAQFHDAADSFVSAFPRRPADLSHRLDEPLAHIMPLLAPAEENLLKALAAAVRNHFTQYSGHSAGICHGDVTLDNVLRTDKGLLLLDFDLSAHGYRAADLTGVAATPHWSAFKAGYTTRRPITADDEAAIPYLTVVGRIFNLRFHLRDKPLFRGTESRTEGWADYELAALKQAADDLL